MRRVHALALIALLLFCNAFLWAQQLNPPSPSVRVRHKQPQTNPNNSEEHAADNKRGTKESPIFVEEVGSPKTDAQAAKDEKEEEAKSATDRWTIGLTGLLALVGLLQVAVLIFQSWILRRQTNILEKQVDITRDSDRAWVITTVVFSSDWPDISGKGAPSKSRMILQLVNTGKSPAEIEKVRTVGQLVPKDWVIPESPTYGESDDWDVESAAGEIITPGGSVPALCSIRGHDNLNDFQITQIRNGVLNLFFYGDIRYKDNSGKNRYTQFGYFFYRRVDETDGRPEGMYRMANRQYNYTA
jgi:hypothetical protein